MIERDAELLEEYIRQAWTLTDEELDSIQPGKVDTFTSLFPTDRSAPSVLLPTNRFERENPDVKLLTVLRDPNFFAFTCRALLCLSSDAPLELLPMQQLALFELWHRQFPMLIATRGWSKSTILAIYILLRLLFTQGCKIVVVAAAFRQAKLVFEQVERIWHASPVLRDLVGARTGLRGRESGPRRDIDRCEFIIGDSVAVFLPMGDGSTIRGFRANHVIAEEFNSIREEVYTTVVQGFGSVSANPIQNVKDLARQRVLKRLGLWTAEMDEQEIKQVRGNQSVLSGTCGYAFEVFCKYWKEYKAIIESKGDPAVLEDLFKGPPEPGFNWRAYSVIRIPYELMPPGFMDDATIARAKQTTHLAIFNNEYRAVFSADSNGFFKRSLVESCVVGKADNPNPPIHASCGLVNFTAALRGEPNRQYVFSTDPASESDRFAVTILEVWPEHRRVKYVWSTKKSEHRKKLKKKLVEEHNFYRYCARKLRDLMAVFPCLRLMCDAGGGGVALREALCDPDKLKPGELPIYEVIDEDKPKDSDDLAGLHILEMVNFRNSAWVSEANHGLKKDLEDKVVLFPSMDAASIGNDLALRQLAGLPVAEDEQDANLYDTLEDCVLEIEELKTELTTIVLTKTATGVEHWDTPDAKLPGAKKGRQRKDRYSAFLMANMGARIIARTPADTAYGGILGVHVASVTNKKSEKPGPFVKGPAWYVDAVGDGAGFGTVIRHG